MQETTERERIFKRIRLANMDPISIDTTNVDMKKGIYQPLVEDLDISFALELNRLSGHFVYCASKNELLGNIKRLFDAQKVNKVHIKHKGIINLIGDLGVNVINNISKPEDIKIAITSCEALVARLGSVLISSKQDSGRLLNFISDTHIIIASRDQIVETVKDAMILMQEKYGERLPSMMSLISGPSRSNAIEHEFILGAHGPRNLIVFLTEDNLL